MYLDLESFETTEEVNHVAKKFKHEDQKIQKFNIQNYIENLNEEDRKWRELYSKRKARVQDASKIYKTIQEGGQKSDLSCLTDSERAFLSSKPDYEEFNRNLHQLQKFATKVAFLHLSSENFKHKSISKLNSEIEKATDRIIKLED